jgi:hypothetical protein
MKVIALLIIAILFTGCNNKQNEMKKILFLHHSTGWNIWLGKTNKYVYKITGRSDVTVSFNSIASGKASGYSITEMFFPKAEPYGWNNYPYDYYNIWVKNAGNKPYMEESTLEILTQKYDLIIFKHCFPVSNILPDTGNPDINSGEKRLENFKLQYDALKHKMHEFADNKFIVWTPAVNVRSLLSEDEALRTRQFHDWIVNEWDEKGDNIFIWDFYNYETEGDLYFPDKYSTGKYNSHPNVEFSSRVAPLFSEFISKVINSQVE